MEWRGGIRQRSRNGAMLPATAADERARPDDDVGGTQSASSAVGHRSFAALVPMHSEVMLRVAAALVGVADAEDAAQEAVVRAWQAWSTLRDVEALRTWLLRITVNVCRQWERGGFGKRQRLTLPLIEGGNELLAALDADPGTSDHTGALDLRSAINALDDDLRLVVVLRYYGGMDATEAGATLGIPASTVRTRLRRALITLRRRLDDSGEWPTPSDQEGGR